MLIFEQIPGTNIIEFTLDGSLTRSEYDALEGKMEEMIAAHGEIRLIEVIEDIGRMEASAIWRDLRWTPANLKHFSHVAVVADQKWIEWMVAPLRMFVRAQIRLFHLDEIDEARRWIRSAE